LGNKECVELPTRRLFGTDEKDLDPFCFDFGPQLERLITPPKAPKNYPGTMADPFVDASNARGIHSIYFFCGLCMTAIYHMVTC
jgi:hypothetical protein